jgi:rhamnosyltransferase
LPWALNIFEIKRMPKILVLLATCNGEPWLREQLESILSQEGADVHVLVGDDVSKDGTRKLLEVGFGDESRIQVCGWENGSGSAGANFRRLYGRADLTGYDFVALADQDDIWMPRKLISAVELLQKTGAHGYSCSVQAFWPDGREKVLGQNNKVRAADFLFEGAGQGCTFVVRAELFARVHQFCQEHHNKVEALHYHDWLIYLLSRAWKLAWCFDSRPFIRYRQHGGNEIGSRGGMSAVTRRLSMIKSGWYLAQVKAAIDVYHLAGGDNNQAGRVAGVIGAKGSASRRFSLLYLVLSHARRRLADRFVLSFAVLVGWL